MLLKTARRRSLPLLVLMLAAASSSGIASAKPKPKPKPPPPVEVEAGGGPVAVLWSWDPESVTIPVGGSVRWINDTTAPHNVSAYSPNWDAQEPVETDAPVTWRFTEPGTYLYYCDVISHGFVVGETCLGMCGTVVVE